MKIGFVVEGISNFKVFGALIREANKYNITPVLIVSESGGGKEYDVVSSEVVRKSFPGVLKENVKYYGNRSIVDIAKEEELEGVLFINAYRKYVNEITALRIAKVRTYALDYFVNSLYAAAWEGEEKNILTCLEGITERLVMSEYFKNLEFKVNPSSQAFEEKFIVVGAPIFDVNNYIDKGQARELVGLPANKKIVVVFAPNIRKTHLRKIYGFKTKAKIRRVLKNIRKYCDQKGYLLVVKNRIKQWEDKFYRNIADYYITDIKNVSYPYVSALMLADCELLVHFGSMAVLEAVVVGVPSIGIGVSGVDKLHTYMGVRARQIIKEEFFQEKDEAIFNFKGVSENIMINTSFDEMNDLFEKMILSSKGSLSRHRAFRKKFLSSENNEASRKILMRLAASK